MINLNHIDCHIILQTCCCALGLIDTAANYH